MAAGACCGGRVEALAVMRKATERQTTTTRLARLVSLSIAIVVGN
jgi:hypothetical protein